MLARLLFRVRVRQSAIGAPASSRRDQIRGAVVACVLWGSHAIGLFAHANW
jgi:tryptophan synthase beta subunit